MQFLFKFHKTPLLLAIEKGNKEIVEVLLQHRNIDVNAKIEIEKYLNLYGLLFILFYEFFFIIFIQFYIIQIYAILLLLF